MTLRYACQRVIDEIDLRNCDCSFDKISPEMDAEQIDALLDDACDDLVKITGLPVGRCVTVYRPCRDYCHYFDCPCGCAPGGIPLPGIMPTVTQVKIDGVVIPPNTYAVIKTPGGRRSLERFQSTGAPDSWPSAQMVAAPDSVAGTFSISVEAGVYPDMQMKLAAAEIACDYLHQLAGEREPADGIQSANVYGETVAYTRFGDPTDQTTMSLAGLGQVRRFIAAAGALSLSAIASNDLMRGWTLYERE